MHLLGETEPISNDNKTTMSGVAVDVRLKRQTPVSSKPPLKLRLTSRATSNRHQQPATRERSSSWHPDTATFSIFRSSASTLKTWSKIPVDASPKATSTATSSSNNVKVDSSGGNKLLIHHQRQNLKNRFQLQKTLGEGTYGKVKLASDKSTGELVAIKYIKKTKIHDENDLARIRREIHILSSLRHKHIVNIREVFEKKDKIVLVMDYAQGGELYDYLNKMGQLSESEARRIFRQIVSAIHNCHQNGIVHRDLKLENIILDDQGNVKIADFGLSNYYSLNDTLKTYCGSPLYASPEIVNGRPYHGPEVDVWSLGVILYTLVYGAMPFESNDLVTLKRQITEGDYAQPSRPSDAAGLIRHMLTVTPSRRATMDDALRHWWVNFGHSSMPNDEPYSLDDDPQPAGTFRRDLHPVVIHHRHQSSISSDSDLEVDIRPGRWSRRRMQLDSAGNSVSSSVATSPAPTGECRTYEEEVDPASLASGLLKLSPELYEILKGCSSKSLAALLHQDNDFECAHNTSQNSNPQCHMEETTVNTSEKSSPTVFDSERKPPRSILKRKGKFSGGDSGCIMHEDLGPRAEESSIPKSGHLPKRLPSFREEAHGIFSSKHKASQLLETADSQVAASLPQPTLSVSSPLIHRRHEEQHSHQQSHTPAPSSQQPPMTLDPIHHCLTAAETSTNFSLVSTASSDLSSPSTLNSLLDDLPDHRTNSMSPSSTLSTLLDDLPDHRTNSKVVRRPKSILKNAKAQSEEAKNRLSISSVGSNSSADILDLSYDSGDSDHFVNQSSPGKSEEVDLCSPSQDMFDVKDLAQDMGHLTVSPFTTSPRSFPRHRRSLSDDCRKINIESALTYTLPRDVQSLR